MQMDRRKSFHLGSLRMSSRSEEDPGNVSFPSVLFPVEQALASHDRFKGELSSSPVVPQGLRAELGLGVPLERGSSMRESHVPWGLAAAGRLWVLSYLGGGTRGAFHSELGL